LTCFYKKIWYLLCVGLCAGSAGCTELRSTLPGALQGVVKKAGTEPADGALVYTHIGGKTYSTLAGIDGFFSLAIPGEIDSHIYVTAWAASSSTTGHVSYNQVTLSGSPQFNIGNLGALGCTFGDGTSGSIICPKSDVPDITDKVSTEVPLDLATDLNHWILAPTGESDSLFIHGEPTEDGYGAEIRIPGTDLPSSDTPGHLVFDANDLESSRTLALTKQDLNGTLRRVPASGNLELLYDGPGNPAQVSFSDVRVQTDGSPEPQPVTVSTRIAGIPRNAATLPSEDKVPLFTEPGEDDPIVEPPDDDDDDIEIHYSVQTSLEDWDEMTAVTRQTNGTGALFSKPGVILQGDRTGDLSFDMLFPPALYALLAQKEDFTLQNVDNQLAATLEESTQIVLPSTLVLTWENEGNDDGDSGETTLWQLSSIETLKFNSIDFGVGDCLDFIATNSNFRSLDPTSGALNPNIDVTFQEIIFQLQMVQWEPPDPGESTGEPAMAPMYHMAPCEFNQPPL